MWDLTAIRECEIITGTFKGAGCRRRRAGRAADVGLDCARRCSTCSAPSSTERACSTFAGTGAIGLEALSRGAVDVTFVERDPRVIRVLRENIAPAAPQTRVLSSATISCTRGRATEAVRFDPAGSAVRIDGSGARS